MNFRRLVSAVAALAVAGTMCAGLAVTASAETNELYERGTATAWSDSDLNDWELTGNSAATPTISDTYGLYAYNNMTGCVTKTFSVTDKAIVTYDIDFYTSGNTGRSNNYEYIRIGSALTIGYVNYTGATPYIQGIYYSLDGGTTYADEVLVDSSAIGAVTNIKAVIDTSTGYLESLTVGGTEVSSVANQYLGDSATYNSVSMGFVRAGSVSWSVGYGIQAISVMEETQDVEMVGYTVQFLDATTNATIKDAVTGREGVVGKSASATSDDIVSFVAGDYKYTYNESKSADTATITELSQTAEDNIITLYFDAHEAVTIPVTATCGDLEIYTDGVSVYEGDSYSYSPCAYYEYSNTDDNSNDGFYVYSGLTETGGVTAVSGTEATSGDSIAVAYTKVTDENIIYYSEIEDLDNTGDSYDESTSSGGIYGAALGTTPSSLGTTLSAGSYVLTVRYISRTDRGIYIRDMAESDYSNYIGYVDFDTQGSSTGLKTISFTLDDDTEIGISRFYPNSATKINQSSYIDYIYITSVPTIDAAIVTTETSSDITNYAPSAAGTEQIMNTDDSETDYTYSTLLSNQDDPTVTTTVYAKITNPTTDVDPVIWVGGSKMESKWSAVGDTNIYFAQFIGTLSEFGEIKITYDGAAEKVVQEATE